MKKNLQAKSIFLYIAVIVLGGLIGGLDTRWCIFKQLNSILYVTMIISWAKKNSVRTNNKTVRRLLTCIGLLMVIWYIIIMCKSVLFAQYETLSRYFWYLYHVPMIFIAYLSVLIAVKSDNNDNERMVTLYIPVLLVDILLTALIITNDRHQFAFLFVEGITDWSNDYRYGAIYYITVVWISVQIIMSAIIFYRKCSLSAARKSLSFTLVPIALGLVLILVTVVSHSELLLGIFHFRFCDIYCFTVILFLDSFINIGFIPSNTGYDSFFKSSDINAFITNDRYEPKITSKEYHKVPIEDMEKAVRHSQVRVNDYLLNGRPVMGGYVFWTRHLSRINALNSQLKDVNEQLTEEQSILQAEVDNREDMARAHTKNRLYDDLAELCKPRYRVISELLEDFTADEQTFRENLKTACAINAYIKRRVNLALLAESQEYLDVLELKLAVEELFENLKLKVRVCAAFIDADGFVHKDCMFDAFDFIEAVLEKSIDCLDAIMVTISADDGLLRMNINLETGERLFSHDSYGKMTVGRNAVVLIEQDEDECYITFEAGYRGEKA